jgi:adenosylmethionine-8-amino-7-oxononanoate aminotransferase
VDEHALLRPYSWINAEPKLRVVSGTGSYVFDDSGVRYFDAVSGLWNLPFGLGNPALCDAANRQLSICAYASLFDDGTHSAAELLAATLAKLLGGQGRQVYLSTTGSSAVEAGIWIARAHFKALNFPTKSRILSFDRSYHGGSSLTISASGSMRRVVSQWGDLQPGFDLVPSPTDEAASLAAISELLKRKGNEIACFLVEPVLASAGVIVPSVQYYQELSSLCRGENVLILADEVATGLGRCGVLLASTVLGLDPDIVTLAKGLSAGYFPVAATVMTEDVVAPLRRAGLPLLFGSTQDGNPVGCAVALAALEYLRSNDLCTNAANAGHMLRSRLAACARHEVVKEIRGMGLMTGLELAHCDEAKTPFSYGEVLTVREHLRRKGLLVCMFETGISLFPPLTITEDGINEIVGPILGVLSAF